MRPVLPQQPPAGARLVILAKDHPSVEPFLGSMDADGVVMSEWTFTAEELASIVNGGRLRLWTYTARAPWQPVWLEIVEWRASRIGFAPPPISSSASRRSMSAIAKPYRAGGFSR